MTASDFKVVGSLLDDHRRIIAAGKAQRWDVVKWAVTVNVGIATASLALQHPVVFLSFSLLVATIGIVLIFHYTQRMTGARNNAARAYEYLQAQKINMKSMAKDD